MRLAIFNWSNRLVGGAESYLSALLPLLAARGVVLGFLHEIDGPSDRGPIPLPDRVADWNAAALGPRQSLQALRDWKPDVIFGHGSLNAAFLEEVISVAPTVQFLHSYVGRCISGAKAFKFPTPRPCPKRFGWGCLLHFYPRRCGGWSPVTAWRLFREQGHQLDNLRRCALLVTHSHHMREEYLQQGFPAERVVSLRFFVTPPEDAVDLPERRGPASALLFLGRMDALKGGAFLLEALPVVQRRLGRPLELTLAGDGPARREWEQAAAQLGRRHSEIRVHFAGWVDRSARGALFRATDLLVMPSLWPEPFGLGGLEAGFYGVPAAAFRVGGIVDWLEEGKNGHLAPGNPPTVMGLAEAMTRCLTDQQHLERLRAGALEVSRRHDAGTHVDRLLSLLVGVAGVSAHSARTNEPSISPPS